MQFGMYFKYITCHIFKPGVLNKFLCPYFFYFRMFIRAAEHMGLHLADIQKIIAWRNVEVGREWNTKLTRAISELPANAGTDCPRQVAMDLVAVRALYCLDRLNSTSTESGMQREVSNILKVVSPVAMASEGNKSENDAEDDDASANDEEAPAPDTGSSFEFMNPRLCDVQISLGDRRSFSLKVLLTDILPCVAGRSSEPSRIAGCIALALEAVLEKALATIRGEVPQTLNNSRSRTCNRRSVRSRSGCTSLRCPRCSTGRSRSTTKWAGDRIYGARYFKRHLFEIVQRNILEFGRAENSSKAVENSGCFFERSFFKCKDTGNTSGMCRNRRNGQSHQK